LKILVAVKRVLDASVRVRIKTDGSGFELEHVKMSINPFDEIAVEEAVRLKEAGIATEVVVATIGTTQCQDMLRGALALGADRAILVESDADVQPLAVAKVLSHLCRQEAMQLLILGKQAIDGDSNQVGQMAAALLDWPQATFASKILVSGGEATVTREVDGGLETVALTLPAVITTDLRLNEPRYPNLPNIIKAKKKPLDIVPASSLGLDIAPRLKTLKVSEPPVRAGGIKVADVSALVEKLKHEAKVI
jgi:electron transfer flavoprotein beta subunit